MANNYHARNLAAPPQRAELQAKNVIDMVEAKWHDMKLLQPRGLAIVMKILKFKRYSILDEVLAALTKPSDDQLEEALVIGRRRSGARFSFMTNTNNIPELIGYLEAIKTDLTMEMIYQAERDDEVD
ncbi:MAG: hypothetical protein AMR96_04080 [Candidatus Adiutrix intracellularis]|jgi:hypothetical protein|nr:MAG: hypothetical protein AMR96_04080 [Candidatus Adiutrix intracellularis]MDR2827628.1 hypothetical protein [Candidatus Adiutrix intracellularis]